MSTNERQPTSYLVLEAELAQFDIHHDALVLSEHERFVPRQPIRKNVKAGKPGIIERGFLAAFGNLVVDGIAEPQPSHLTLETPSKLDAWFKNHLPGRPREAKLQAGAVVSALVTPLSMERAIDSTIGYKLAGVRPAVSAQPNTEMAS